MDGQLLTPSETEKRTATEIFEDAFPLFLSYGMSEADYWDGDNSLPKAYHKAHQLKLEEQNRLMHRMGAYIYEALSRLQPFAVGFLDSDKPQRPSPYLDYPLPLTEKEAKAQEKQREIDAFNAYRAQMIAYAASQTELHKND